MDKLRCDDNLVMTHMVSSSHEKVLSLRDIILFTVSGILLVDFVAVATSLGSNTMFWWPVFMIIFFVPVGLMTAELGSRFPEQGGIYSWVRRAFGYRSGSRITWFYWVNVALWMPSIYLIFSGILSAMFFPDMTLFGHVAIGIALAVFTYLINVMKLNDAKWIPNIGAYLKAIVSIAIGLGGLVYGFNNGFANDIRLENFTSNLSEVFIYAPVVVYSLLGFELVCASADEMKNPRKDIPKAIFISAPIIAFAYLFCALGILAAVPAEEIDAIDVIAKTVFNLFGDSGLGLFMAYAVGITALLSFLANIATWTMGANRTVAEAAEEGELPKIFGKLHSTNKTPIGAAGLTAVISIAVQIIYGLMATNAEDLFWSIFSFSAIIFLIPYIYMCFAFLKLRAEYASQTDVFVIPGGEWVGRVLAWVSSFILLATIVLFIYTPGEPVDWSIALPIIIGVFISLGIGEVLIRAAESNNQSNHDEAGELAPSAR